MQDLHVIGKNIQILREEQHLSTAELAEKSALDEEIIIALENGEYHPTNREVLAICPFLKISKEDLLERNIEEENKQAKEKFKQTKSDKTYNWVYKNRRRKIYYLIILLAIILGFVGGFLYLKFLNPHFIEMRFVDEDGNSVISPNMVSFLRILFSMMASSLIAAPFMFIELFTKTNLRFNYWYITIFVFASSIIWFAATVALIPFCVYLLINLFKRKKGEQ